MSMGTFHHRVIFNGEAPSVDRIVAKIQELSGQPVIASARSDSSDLYVLNVDLAFSEVPEAKIHVYAYRPGAVRDHAVRSGVADMPHARVVEGMDEQLGRQTLHLWGFVGGANITLLEVAEVALDALGGDLEKPLSQKDRDEFSRPISSGDLVRQHQHARWDSLMVVALLVIVSPLMLVVGLLEALWALVALPWRVAKAWPKIKDWKVKD